MLTEAGVDKDYFTISVAAIGWICLLCVSFSLLTGCVQMDGDGFVNGRGPQKAVICKKISPSFIKCEDVEDK
jgi:hypothetical protein